MSKNVRIPILGNNSGFTEDRAVKFTCSMGFLYTADRMMWPPYYHVTGSDHA